MENLSLSSTEDDERAKRRVERLKKLQESNSDEPSTNTTMSLEESPSAYFF
jgi:hypothetical protein